MHHEQQQNDNATSTSRYQSHATLYSSEKEEILLEVPFDFREWRASLVVAIVTMVLTVVGIPFLLTLPLAYLRFRYIFRHRHCYVTPTAIVLTMLSPALILFLPNRTEKTVQLSKIVDITIQQSWAQKMFGVCTIQIQNPGQTVSQDGIPTSNLSLTGIEENQAQHVKRQLLSLANRVKRGEDINLNEYGSLASPSAFPNEEVLTGTVTDIRQSLLRIEKILEAGNKV